MITRNTERPPQKRVSLETTQTRCPKNRQDRQKAVKVSSDGPAKEKRQPEVVKVSKIRLPKQESQRGLKKEIRERKKRTQRGQGSFEGLRRGPQKSLKGRTNAKEDKKLV